MRARERGGDERKGRGVTAPTPGRAPATHRTCLSTAAVPAGSCRLPVRVARAGVCRVSSGLGVLRGGFRGEGPVG